MTLNMVDVQQKVYKYIITNKTVKRDIIVILQIRCIYLIKNLQLLWSVNLIFHIFDIFEAK